MTGERSPVAFGENPGAHPDEHCLQLRVHLKLLQNGLHMTPKGALVEVIPLRKDANTHAIAKSPQDLTLTIGEVSCQVARLRTVRHLPLVNAPRSVRLEPRHLGPSYGSS
jgi:hypothetical protein